MEHLRNLLKGFAAAGNVLAEPRAYQRLENGFDQDRANLRSDADRAVSNLNRIVKKYGKQEYTA